MQSLYLPPFIPLPSSTVKMQRKSRRLRSKRIKPVLNRLEFNKQHLELLSRQELYWHRNYRNKVVVPKSVLRQMERKAEKYLHANNIRSRIRFTGITADVFSSVLSDETREIIWITLTPEKFAFNFEDACKFDARRLQSWTRQVLPGVSFLGMIDVGCYPIMGQTHSAFTSSFHVHLLALGTSEDRMEELATAINQRYQAYVPRRRTCHWRRVSPMEGIGRIYYMMKSPLKSARFVPKLSRVDPLTGELIERGEDRHYKEQITSGRAARMSIIMEHHCLDKLLFAAGTCNVALAKIRRIGLAPLRQLKAA